MTATLHDTEIQGIANIGLAPTITNYDTPLLEVHLLEDVGDIYGEQLHVTIDHFIRPEQKFNSIEELKSQIQNDIKENA